MSDVIEDQIGELRVENGTLRAQVRGLEKQLEEAEEKIDELKDDLNEKDSDEDEIAHLSDVAGRLLDEIDRPAGALKGFKAKQGPALDRALVALFDAVGRNP